MESTYTKLAHYGSKNECGRTDNVFSPISEICNGTVSLITQKLQKNSFRGVKYNVQYNVQYSVQ